MTMTDPTCDERIAGQMAGRADDVRKMLAAQGGETVCRHCGQVITEGKVYASGGEHRWSHPRDGGRHAYFCASGAPTAHAEPDEDVDEDSLSSFGLEVTRKVTLKFLMSTGGPADWLEILCDGGYPTDKDPGERTPLEVERVTYHFSDWFDHAECEVAEGSPLYDLAEWIAEGRS